MDPSPVPANTDKKWLVTTLITHMRPLVLSVYPQQNGIRFDHLDLAREIRYLRISTGLFITLTLPPTTGSRGDHVLLFAWWSLTLTFPCWYSASDCHFWRGDISEAWQRASTFSD